MIIWRDELEGHAHLFDLQYVRRGDFVVQYLVLRYYTLFFRHFLRHSAGTRSSIPLSFFSLFNPFGVAIYFMQYCLVFVATA